MTDHPHILLTVSEDCPPWFGCYGDPLAATPNLDALAARGVTFDQAYSAAPVCAPSRFALLTGVPPQSHAPAHQMRANAALPPWLHTWPELLRSRGYHCTNNAKTDYNCDVDPAAVWDESSLTAHWRSRPTDTPFVSVVNLDTTHESAVFARDTVTVEPDKVTVPPGLPDLPEIRADIAQYYGRIARMDAAVGDLLAQLDEDGLTDSTIVIHTSDHGGVAPRSKRYCYDSGLHVPLIIAAPPRWAHLLGAPGSRVRVPVSTISIPPTILTLTGTDVPEFMQHRPLTVGSVPQEGFAVGMRNRMDERDDMVRTIRSSRYRYVRNYQPFRPNGRHQGFAWHAAGYRAWDRAHRCGGLTGPTEAFWHPRPPVELYDTWADPGQLENLAGRPEVAAIERELAARLRESMLNTWDNGFLHEDSPHQGWDDSRVPGAYPLPRLLALTDLILEPDPIIQDRLVTALVDPDATIRRWAALTLHAHRSTHRLTQSTVAALAAAAQHDDDPHVRVSAAEVWAIETGDDVPCDLLVAHLTPDVSPAVRLGAVEALTALPSDAVAPHRDVVATVAAEPGRPLRTAARYLLLQLDGHDDPDTRVLDIEQTDFTHSLT
ncbi:sulfatase-like hydrolase/transferase [Ruania alba]|uniref:Sulfatase n=1 Tax=Ruania alba TaxID=648782 RepID=A0A1H5LMU4_9MICO|nr:sulfatase-like hydrolase/transferase [Ruania alba]SEE77847.1 Sulfatase [Ruania alba]